ncbi:MAG: DUF1642 domain-containing protein [Streptococcus parasanguinis]|nr:DUF1642 domain-containing protein [Streptococcus parasanguinis]
MNKQELIDYCESLKGSLNKFINGIDVNKIIAKIKQLDEPQKPVVLQFVADWYEEYKDNLEYNIWDWMKYNLEPKKRENVIFSRWLGKTANNPVETLVKMKLYGYTVEKEPKYTVKIKSVNQYLVRNTDEDFLGFLQSRLKSKFTRKELEEAGFGWVFDCPGIEIEEVGE